MCLLSVMVFGLCFQAPMWLPCSPTGAQSLRFVPLQHFSIYPWQAYVPPDDGLWLMPGVHGVAAYPTALSRKEPPATHSAVLQPFQQCGGAYSVWGLCKGMEFVCPQCEGTE